MVALLGRFARAGDEILIADMERAGARSAMAIPRLCRTLARPAKANEPVNGIHLATIRQRIESIVWSVKDCGRTRSAQCPVHDVGEGLPSVDVTGT